MIRRSDTTGRGCGPGGRSREQGKFYRCLFGGMKEKERKEKGVEDACKSCWPNGRIACLVSSSSASFARSLHLCLPLYISRIPGHLEPFFALIVFDFRPIKVDSAHWAARAPCVPIGRLDQKRAGAFAISRSHLQTTRRSFPSATTRCLRGLAVPRYSKKYYLSASCHINTPYAMIIKVSRDAIGTDDLSVPVYRYA